MNAIQWSEVLTNPVVLLVVYFLLINVVAFFAYGWDKLKAKREMRRVSELTLLMLAVVGGGVGALMGMNVWRHKTQHWKFTIGVPLIILLQVVLSAVLIAYWNGCLQ